MTTDDFTAALQLDEAKGTIQRLSRQLALAKSKNEALVEATMTAATDAVRQWGPPKPIKAPAASRRKGTPEVALWHLTDWQGGKVTTSYDSTIARERVEKFCRTAKSITEIHRSDHPVDECVIAFGGDMIEGLFNYSTQLWEIDMTLYEQFVTYARLIADTVLFAASVYRKVKIVAEWGNHGRIGDKRSSVPKNDNADRMTYRLAQEMTKHEPRITWQDAPEDIQRLEIGNYRALVIHGDEFGRGGFASPATIIRHCDRWRSGAYAWDFRDVYIGHYHNNMQLSMANGEGTAFWTGALESDNRYARDTMSASAIPSQRLHFIQPVKGHVTAQYQIWLAEKSTLGAEKVR